MYYHGCNMSKGFQHLLKGEKKKVACMMCPMFLNVTSNVFYLYCLLENMWTENKARLNIKVQHKCKKQSHVLNIFVQLGPISPMVSYPFPYIVLALDSVTRIVVWDGDSMINVYVGILWDDNYILKPLFCSYCIFLLMFTAKTR